MRFNYIVVILISVCLLISTKNIQAQAKLCRSSQGLIHRSFWNRWTGYLCYHYDKRVKFKYNYTIIPYDSSYIPVTFINNKTDFFWYDFRNETSLNYIRPSYKSDTIFEKWKTCAQEASNCCDYSMTSENINPSDEYPCPAIWDDWSCFSPAKAGSVSKILCPDLTFSSEIRECELQAQKECFRNGTWKSKTDYGPCSVPAVLKTRHRFHIIVLSVAAVLSAPAVAIFYSFRAFRLQLRFILHRNLILVIIIKNLLVVITKEMVIMEALTSDGDDTILNGNSVTCRVLAFFENVAKNGVFAAMFLDGFDLHRSIVRPFADAMSSRFVYCAFFVLSCCPALIWALLRGLHQGEFCWVVDNTGDQWVTDAFRLTILTVNFVLLVDIIRVIVLKLRHDSVSQQTKTTLRVTLFLVPLFGVHIVITVNRNMVPDNTCDSMDVYYFATYLIEGLQGVLVAFLFCYINKEVHHEIMNAWRKTVICLQQKLDAKSERTTSATIVESMTCY
ncbi:corticotropin-releasing factor receptor 2 [Tribolium castaneum]|uniref:Calcitonin gene-related peptide type 1 receptor-like Protein n=1 Tax=Tribolium castaneum TaxID=7070 RepID=D6WAU9_TRICA|nr:PREDICTED: corticotropin-releasing factor receptor 2 [Tribolium castaneum]EEZ99292.1 Calcitonin gene-related peptide type 1 receptor-like Protein [Tribolium castaneum]|eukprot:XP_968807.1 PREDICTED: corticotropin-releasing factor receptor 2 [Tribolium castaneum]